MADSYANREIFDRMTERYERHAALEQEVCRRLLQRCDFHRLPPKRILDLGCGPGQGSEALKRRFRHAQVIGLDFAPAMLGLLRRRSRLRRPLLAVCGDVSRLPFARSSMDMLFSSLAQQWSPDLSALFDEYRYVLRPDGMLLFATLGPGSLADLAEAWAALDASVSLVPLPDLLEVGNALMAAGFREPVMDMERITVDYPSLRALAQELDATGTSMLVNGWAGWEARETALERALSARRNDGRLSVTYEIVYGTAFGPPEGQPRRIAGGEVATISVDSLLKSRPMG